MSLVIRRLFIVKYECVIWVFWTGGNFQNAREQPSVAESRRALLGPRAPTLRHRGVPEYIFKITDRQGDQSCDPRTHIDYIYITNITHTHYLLLYLLNGEPI